MLRFIIIFFCLILLACPGCYKPKPKPPPTDLGFLPIDSICKRYWAFKEGSWWVYENKKGGKNSVPGWKDTIDCVHFEDSIKYFESEYWKLSTEWYYFVHRQRNKDEYGNQPEWENSIHGPEAGYGKERPPTDQWAMRRYKWNPYGGWIACFIYPYTAAIPGESRFISDTIINGVQCHNVIVQYNYPDAQLPDAYEDATEIFWAENIGIVRYRSMTRNLWDIQIVNFNVIRQ